MSLRGLLGDLRARAEATDDPALRRALAQRIAADCANEAGRIVLEFPNSPRPGLLCQDFKRTFHQVLSRAVPNAQITTLCHEQTTPHVIEF